MENENKTLVTFVLDQSGSMENVREHVVSGFNEYIEKLKSESESTLLRLVSFNSANMDIVYDFDDVNTVRKLAQADYVPDGLTPLYDAIGASIKATEKFLSDETEPAHVIFTIMTDGHENNSSDYSRSHIFKLISQKEREGWLFAYLGSNQDSWATGQSIGIDPLHSADYDPANPANALKTLSESTSRARRHMRTGAKIDSMFTREERRKLMEQKKRRNKPN